jgi:hypothetical protein
MGMGMVIDPKDVTCVVVTRGDHNLKRVFEHLNQYFSLVHFKVNKQYFTFGERMMKNDDFSGDDKVYGRYVVALKGHLEPVVYVQDDDCLVDIPEVLAHYEPGIVTCNIRHTHTNWYTDKFYNVAPVGWGAVFDRDLIEPAFSRYLSRYPKDDFFLRECDRIFTGLNRVKRVTAGCVNLPWAHGGDRMCNEKRHGADFREAVTRVQGLLGGEWTRTPDMEVGSA